MRVLIVGAHNDEIAAAIEMALRQGATLRHVMSPAAARDELCAGRGADLVLIDVAADIARLIRALAAERIFVPVVAYGVRTDARAAVAAVRAGAREFLPLPPDPELIAAILAAVGDDRRELVFEDPAMWELLRVARQIAPSEASVLITGESGTGKEMVARYLHRHSRRAERSFVSVNCAAIPENLLESELFGHEKGAFTGAAARRIGKFEEASGGTLLLDEISEMDPRLQAKLLRRDPGARDRSRRRRPPDQGRHPPDRDQQPRPGGGGRGGPLPRGPAVPLERGQSASAAPARAAGRHRAALRPLRREIRQGQRRPAQASRHAGARPAASAALAGQRARARELRSSRRAAGERRRDRPRGDSPPGRHGRSNAGSPPAPWPWSGGPSPTSSAT